MIPNAGQITAALAGAFRLLRFDAGGLRFFDGTIDGYWRSFFCAVLILPVYVLGVALRLDDGELANTLFRIVVVKGIGYAIAWTAFPLVMVYLANSFDRAEQYPGYIAAYNWFAAPTVVLTVAVALLIDAGLFPVAVQTGLDLGVVFYLTAVQWFIARRALDIHPGTAVGVVVVDVLISLLLATITSAMLERPAGV